MEQVCIEDKTFDRGDFTLNPLAKGEYENCRFINCDFSNSDLRGFIFSECEFTGCNLSLAALDETAFRYVKFKDSKMLGLRFENCIGFGFAFYIEGCSLNHSSFYQMKLKKTIFRNSQLRESDFTGSDLTSSVFDNCDLAGAVFENSVIEKADFRTSFNYSIDPVKNRIKKAKFSLSGIPGLLNKYDIEIDGIN